MNNPLSDKLMPWRMAQVRIALVSAITLPVRISTELWKSVSNTFSNK